MKALLILVALAAPRRAEAKGCHEVSRVVGYSRCWRFGWWSSTSAMSWDAGASWLRFDARPSDAMAADDRPVTALGFRGRALIGFPHQLYVVAQADLAEMIGSPQLITARGGSMPSPSGGSVGQETLALGWRTPLGPLTVAGELAPGARLTKWTAGDIALSAAWSFLLQARAKADVWLAPGWSLGVAAGSDVLHLGDYSVAITLGLHVVPYDGLH